MTLDEAIAQQIGLGLKDPVEIARTIEKRSDRHWLANALFELGEDIIAERARRRLNAGRRANVIAIRPGSGIDKAQLGLRSLWVPNLIAPGVGAWKPMNECTPDDFDSAAAYREGAARSILVQAGWFRELSARMRAARAATFLEFKGELPVLPEADESEPA